MAEAGLEGRRLAAVAVDMQRKFTIEGRGSVAAEVAAANRIAAMFRAAGLPVVFVRYDGPVEHGTYAGEDGDELFEGLVEEPSDIRVSKRHMNSFRGTDLAEQVKARGCDGVVVFGTVTQYCVAATYFGAFDCGLVPYLADSACISSRPEVDAAARVLFKTVSEDALRCHLSESAGNR